MAKHIRSVEGILLLFILLLSACLALTAPGFLSWQNFFDLLNQNAVKMILRPASSSSSSSAASTSPSPLPRRSCNTSPSAC